MGIADNPYLASLTSLCEQKKTRKSLDKLETGSRIECRRKRRTQGAEMTIGELDNVKATLFTWDKSDKATFLVIESDRSDYLDFCKRYGHSDTAKRAEGLEFDGRGKLFFAVFVQDCFDPPLCVVRADNGCEAEEIFVNAKDWADVSETDAKDYPEEHLHATDRGTMYDPQSVSVREVFLKRIDF